MFCVKVEAFMRDQQTVPAPIEEPVSFAARMLSSEGFMHLFREGMSLVEDTAAYLDGDGRTEARKLERMAALTYASESMRLTTRLMQMTSWLLLQRAVREGELTTQEAADEHRKVKIRKDEMTSSAENLAIVPERLATLITRTDRLYGRIVRLDTLSENQTPSAARSNMVASQLGALQAAFGARLG
jgi:regulator of CtrA degradation